MSYRFKLMGLMFRVVAILFVWLLASPSTGILDAHAIPTTIYFDDTDPNTMVLGNNFYEIGFRKSNGSIAYITDKATGQYVSRGSRYECLWGAVFSEGTSNYMGGCLYNSTGVNRFSYAWSTAAHQLALNYNPDPAASQRVAAQVLVTAYEDHWFDMRLQLQNNWGYELDDAPFPSDLVFIENDLEEVLLPILPGVILEPGFFSRNPPCIPGNAGGPCYETDYPGFPGVFADYVSLATTRGQLAIYVLHGQDPVQPAHLGVVHDDAYLPDSTYYAHAYHPKLPDGQTWTSPVVRLHVSEPHLQSIRAYRVANGIDAFTSADAKLGPLYAQVAQSPLYKADAEQLNIPFSQYPSMLAGVPVPGILHPVAYWQGHFDENYPDFLPPDSRWGTTAQMRSMMQTAQAQGFLVMPYVNPTWWDDQSPTLRNLPPPLTITTTAVLNEQGRPRYEFYGSHGGYIMSPFVPFVRQRLDQLVLSMTVTIPSDMLYEDQVGARATAYDYNPAAPTPWQYTEGWLDHTRTYSASLLTTEMGFDLLAETEVGFHGTVLLLEKDGSTSQWWGNGNWRYYPMAPALLRDKTLLYQHTEVRGSTTSSATLTLNLAFGYMLSYDIGVQDALTNPWLKLTGYFQKHVVARYATDQLQNFTALAPNVTQTQFDTFTVTANWDAVNPYDIGQYTLTPQGVLASGNDGTVSAGSFWRYNGVALSPGDHYLIEERGSSSIAVYQPIGPDTSLTLHRLPGWNTNNPVVAWAFDDRGQFITALSTTSTTQDVTFVYMQQIANQPIGFYLLTQPQTTYLPFVRR